MKIKFLILFIIVFVLSPYVYSLELILPEEETDSVYSWGDAADDPAFWFNKNRPSKSVVFGTDKKAGIHAFSLNGVRLDFIPAGRINNIDIRSGFSFDDKNISLMAGSKRDNNTVKLFLITEDGELIRYKENEIKTRLSSIYGLCLYKNKINNKTYIFVSDEKSKSIYQFELLSLVPAKAKMVRKIRTGSISEGCVADDDDGILYFSQEDDETGIYKTEINSKNVEVIQIDLSIKKGGHINGDSEGLALATRGKDKLLIASSQGSSDFVVYNTNDTNQYLGRFAIGRNNDIDAVSNTDGIEAFSQNLGTRFEEGIFIVQDDSNINYLDTEPYTSGERKVNQNFKLIPLKQIFDLYID